MEVVHVPSSKSQLATLSPNQKCLPLCYLTSASLGRGNPFKSFFAPAISLLLFLLEVTSVHICIHTYLINNASIANLDFFVKTVFVGLLI